MTVTDDRGRMRAECPRHQWRSPWTTPGPAWPDAPRRPAAEQARRIAAVAETHLREYLPGRQRAIQGAL